MIETQLEKLATTMGIQLINSNRLDIAFNAVWHPTTKTIVVQHGLDPTTRACAIAHELGHAYYGHDCSNQQAEREADEWAALQLLNFHTVKAAAYACDITPARSLLS